MATFFLLIHYSAEQIRTLNVRESRPVENGLVLEEAYSGFSMEIGELRESGRIGGVLLKALRREIHRVVFEI